MSRIDDFIAQGLLPFVGREVETGKILAFWRSLPEAQRLRVMMLVAEAGVGKSRLLEECLRTIRSERGTVVHVKLYPEATNSLAPLLSRSLWTSHSDRSILRSQPGENMPEVIAALQRLCRLRPTLVVLEDIHLFPSESIPDLVRLFDGLADETISVLCLSRPAAIPVQGVLEPHLIESTRMEGLDREALAGLWNELFGERPPKEILEKLWSTTKGNALAVRSGLRWAIQSGVIVRSPRGDRWTPALAAAPFEQGLRRSVSLVAEGMVAHLRKEDREKAETLATLGEVFARETAIQLDPEIETLLIGLTEQGIIVETIHPVSPFAGVPLTEPGKGWAVEYPSTSAPLLAFTHSLLHGHLADRAAINTPRLLKSISDNAPLYSLVPLRVLEKRKIPDDTDPEILIRVIRRLSAVAVMLDRTTSWRNAADLLKPLYHVLEELEAKADVPAETGRLWRMNAQHVSLSLLRRSMGSSEWIETHERQLEITQAPETLLAAQYRLLAHSYTLDRIGIDKTYEEGVAIVDDLDELLEGYRELRTDISYVYILESLIHHAFGAGDREMMRGVQVRTYRMLADPDLEEGARRAAVGRVLPVLLKFYSSPEELREREESIALIEEYQDETDPYYGTSKIQFLGVSGRFAEALDLIDPVMKRTGDHGLWANFFIAQSWRIVCAVGTGRSLQEMADETDALLRTFPDPKDREPFVENPATALVTAGFLAGRPDEALALIGAFGVSPSELPDGIRVMVELRNGNVRILEELELPIRTGKLLLDNRVLSAWRGLAESGGSTTESPASEIVRELIDLLDDPVIRIYDVLTIHGTLLLWEGMMRAPLPDALREVLHRKTLRALQWLYERNGQAYMRPLTLLLRGFGGTSDAKEWEEKFEDEFGPSSSSPAPSPVVEESRKIRISMLGSIRAALPSEELAPIRGVRIRTLLGLMVADRMIGTPLSGEEFLSLAGGAESDPEHARKKKNMAVVRLREIIGHDAILTDGPTPRLNTDIVSVDLLEIDALVGRGLDAAGHEAFVRALPLIEEGLNLYGGEVPFPTLYEDFFEAARGDFEYRLRRGVLAIGRGMLALGDTAGVEPLLRQAFDALPGDEEIAELLREALVVSGERTEAERIRMRTETA